MKTSYQCEGCNTRFDTAAAALACEAQGLDNFGENLKLGDIVTCGDLRRFGWFDGDAQWLASDTLGDPKAYNHFDQTRRAFGFYYVVTALTGRAHERLVHLETFAMTDSYRGGYTCREHMQVQLVENPPAAVVEVGKALIGRIFNSPL